MTSAANQQYVDEVTRTAIVTGGSRGIGLAIAKRLAEDGARVVIAARSEEDALEAAAAIVAAGGEAIAVACDVRSKPAVERLVARTLER